MVERPASRMGGAERLYVVIVLIVSGRNVYCVV
jgi:hypothetical protein